MNHVEKKQNGALPFSYIDLFFLLLAGLILSFAVYFATEGQREGEPSVYQVELSAYVKGALSDAIPTAGEALYGEDGKEYGEILSVQTEKTGQNVLVRILCQMERARPEVGEEILIETQGFVRPMWVYTVEESLNSEEGGNLL